MIPPFLPKKPDIAGLVNKINPELTNLQGLAKEGIQDGITHLSNIVSHPDEFKKTAAREIVEIVQEGPKKTSDLVDKVTGELGSIAKKTLEAMKESDNPIAQKVAETAEQNPTVNPEEVINKARDIIKETIATVETERDGLEKEIVKEVVKNKVKKGFFGYFKNMFAKIKNFIKNLLHLK